MSARKLGGGRILGSGKGLTPPSAPRSSSPFTPSDSHLAPSESNLSLGSSSVSPPSLSGDIGASISVGAQGKGRGADTAALVCPICCEEMLTLLQLNRHIDDLHQELPTEEQDEVKTWFDKQVLKAKRFQPLSHITQKLRGLDVFESNESPSTPTPATTAASKFPLDGPTDPDELITRKHWQRTTGDDYCTDPTCSKSLGPIAGSINCRHCGRLFCEACTMYQMKISRSANHEPVRGHWARVCETCYKSREGYNDHNGLVNDHTSAFVEVRRRRVERYNLNVTRLEKRLTKLTRLLADIPPGMGRGRKAVEQSVVTWEDDGDVAACPFCRQEFGSWSFRRHHCRICGRVVCADVATGCSMEVGLNVASQTSEKLSPASPGQISIDIRMCRDCNHTIFATAEFTESLLHKPSQQRAYETLRQFERGIVLLLPSFQRTLIALQQPAINGIVNGGRGRNGGSIIGGGERQQPTHAQIQDAAKIRKRLIDAFAKYGAAAKRMRDLPGSEQEKKLQTAVYKYASAFLHTNMLPLKSLPALLRSSSTQHPLRQSSLPSHPLRHSSLPSKSSSPSEAGTVESALEAEEKEVRERLMVLEEQLFLVEAMAQEATKARRFEEVSALGRNRDELKGEVEELRRRVGDVEGRWEGVYRGH